MTTRELGDQVELRVRDNGVGMAPEVLAKLFQPFFTTKPAGEGTGLGLSISYDIVVQEHGGTITADSRVGQFTEFILRLPRSLRSSDLRRQGPSRDRRASPRTAPPSRRESRGGRDPLSALSADRYVQISTSAVFPAPGAACAVTTCYAADRLSQLCFLILITIALC